MKRNETNGGRLLRTEPEGALVALRINHPVHPYCIRYTYVLHILRGDEDILFAVRRLCGVDLGEGRVRS